MALALVRDMLLPSAVAPFACAIASTWCVRATKPRCGTALYRGKPATDPLVVNDAGDENMNPEQLPALPDVRTFTPVRRMWAAHLTGAMVVAALAVGPAWAQTPTQAAPPRIEKDLLGEKQIPGAAYYGVQTLRALENFKLSGVAINHYPGFIEAWAMVKLAAARANTEVGAMKPGGLDRKGAVWG